MAGHVGGLGAPFGRTSAPSSTRHLAQKDLARRWACSTRTLERWRVLGHGPIFLKLNGRVLYRLDDVEAFETERLRASTREGSGAPQR